MPGPCRRRASGVNPRAPIWEVDFETIANLTLWQALRLVAVVFKVSVAPRAAWEGFFMGFIFG